MTIPNGTTTPRQSFQAFAAPCGTSPVSADIIEIDARLDKTGEYIILWNDILDTFDNPKFIMDGTAKVSNEVDDDYEYLRPLRIIYRPDKVLKVVVEQSVFAIQQVVPDSHARVHVASASIYEVADSDGTGALDTTSQHIPDLSMHNTGNVSTSLTLHKGQIAEAQTSLTAYYQMCNSIIAGQDLHERNLQGALKEFFSNHQLDMQENKALQHQILQMQREMERKQDEMLLMQQQALDHLAMIHSRVQAVFTQTFELHEYPIPRLFIVLPKASRIRDKLGNPFAHQFRLFFLCECGTHTMTEGSKIPHEIHLAKHEGYDLDQPTEFFEKYGPYVLTMMQLVKYGFTAAGVVVPALAHFKVVEGIEAIQSGVDLARNNLGSLVDETINFIQHQQSNANGGIDMAAEQISLDKLEVLEGADLRQLESYINVQDQGRVLGNLYRIVTAEGHVKWVCMDHYRENYRESAMQSLRDVVTKSGGDFFEEEGLVSIPLKTKSQAKPFYDAIIKARGVQELVVTPGWDATMADLRTFGATVEKANIVSLTFEGGTFIGPALDVINNGRRFNPIVQLMCNGRVRSLTLKKFDEFFPHVSNSALTTTSQLRYLSLDIGGVLSEDWPTLKKILENCPSLAELAIKKFLMNFETTLGGLIGKNGKLKNLKKLTVELARATVITEYAQGVVKTMGMVCNNFHNVNEDYPSLLLEGQITWLRSWEPLYVTQVAQLSKILDMNPKASSVALGYDRKCAEVMDRITEATDAALFDGNHCGLKQITFMDLETTDFEPKGEHQPLVLVDFPDTLEPSLPSITVDMRAFTQARCSDHLTDLVGTCGAFIGTLITDATFSDDLALVFETVTSLEGSRLISLTLDATLLTPVGVASVARVLGRSENLTNFICKWNESEGSTDQVHVLQSLAVSLKETMPRLQIEGIPQLN